MWNWCSWALMKKSSFIGYISAVALVNCVGEPLKRSVRRLIHRRE